MKPFKQVTLLNGSERETCISWAHADFLQLFKRDARKTVKDEDCGGGANLQLVWQTTTKKGHQCSYLNFFLTARKRHLQPSSWLSVFSSVVFFYFRSGEIREWPVAQSVSWWGGRNGADGGTHKSSLLLRRCCFSEVYSKMALLTWRITRVHGWNCWFQAFLTNIETRNSWTQNAPKNLTRTNLTLSWLVQPFLNQISNMER